MSSAALAALLAAVVGCGDSRPRGENGRGAALSPADSLADCGVPAGDVQIDAPLGVLRPGAAVPDIRSRCAVVRDTILTGAEGMPVRLLTVALGTDSVTAEVVNDTIWRLRLTSARFRSASGFGVGTPARAIAAAPGARVHVGEGEVYMLVAGSCGVSYRIAGADFGRVAAASATAALEELPDTARVDRVLVWRCESASGT
jgi:hypothetical protein